MFIPTQQHLILFTALHLVSFPFSFTILVHLLFGASVPWLCLFVYTCDTFFVCLFTLQLVGQFIARAVSDQILSKSYIEGYKGRVDCEYARYVVTHSGFQFPVSCGLVQNS